MSTIPKTIMRARKTWNAASFKSRSLPEYAALEELYTAALAVAALLEPHVVVEENDDDVEAGFSNRASQTVSDQ